MTHRFTKHHGLGVVWYACQHCSARWDGKLTSQYVACPGSTAPKLDDPKPDTLIDQALKRDVWDRPFRSA